ncbi:exonuclease SbcCD subunit D C-terminal domain-containing protein [Janthinobacterium aquaticum]|uniref:exonuclease SbcCD subunit D C-terminal domain-containing protein n=1 Tax=Janthinobacterium sp. FT58W TaxID=2654254 RepID=UPI0012653441|nr:exonuclease SbcCD subunit D C-terminal domain-containing protein [Janthinobacterium sp. FT58W]KAB8042685.1 exonuclease subunit SbcD [Janthinobacterium sp. FT58W]
MRLLHTSDWHLGQTLHNYERHYEHQCFLDWLLETLVAERIDVLLVAGDVFDNANPSAASQKQLYGFLQQARARLPALQIIVIAGNHDSAGRLEAPGPLLAAQGTHVIGHVLRDEAGQIDLERLLLPLHDDAGNVAAWCLAVPFLRPGDVPKLAPDSPQEPYLGGIALLYRQLTDLALARRTPGQAIIALGHCHMVGGDMSNDSERRIVIGGAEMLPAGIFDPAIAYAALGHLHKAQAVGGHEHIRYSGSPIPLSFAEVHYRHQVLCLELDGAQLGKLRVLDIPRAVPLLRVPEKPAPVFEVLAQLAALAMPEAPPEAQPYLEVRVRLDAPEPGLRARIEAALDGKPVRLAKIETSSAAASNAPAAMTLDQLAQLQPDEIFRRLYQQKFGKEAPPDQLSALAELLLPDTEVQA